MEKVQKPSNSDTHVAVNHKLCGFQGRVGGRVAVMKPDVVAPKILSFVHN
jgi:hypothetical protein